MAGGAVAADGGTAGMNAEYFSLAARTLWKRKLRTSLTMLGIVIAIATLFVLVSISLGLQNAVAEQFRELGTDKFFIFPRGQLAGPGSGGAAQMTFADIAVIDKVSGVKDLTYAAAGNAKVESRGQIRYTQVIGVPTDRGDVFVESGAYKIEEGRFLKRGDQGVVVLGYQFSGTSFFTKGIHAGDSVIINGHAFKVKAIMGYRGNPGDDRLVIMPLEDFQNLFQSGERVDQVIVQVDDVGAIKEIADRVAKKLRSARHVTEKTQDFTILTPEELLASFGAILNILTAFLLGVAGISLLVGAIGIATTMYTSVLERTREIGVMKAVGAKNKDVLSLFMIESGLLGLLGGIMGVILGAAISETIVYIATTQLGTSLLQAAFPVWLIGGCLVFSTVIGAVSGVWPAWQASRTKTVDALRYE